MARYCGVLCAGLLLGVLIPAAVAFAVISVCDIDCADLRD
jgi:hypothetical protein